MSVSKARELLKQAARGRDRLTRHLLVAAALREALSADPVVVGGTAEEYWAADEYHETDLDLCAPLRKDDLTTLGMLGFAKEGRHWWHEKCKIAVEFPDSSIDGDEGRTVILERYGNAHVIGPEDLYLDRLRQATMNEQVEDRHFHSALAVLAGIYEFHDLRYVKQTIARIERQEPAIGRAMRSIDSKLRRRVRKQLSSGPGSGR